MEGQREGMPIIEKLEVCEIIVDIRNLLFLFSKLRF
jgi:hypothetical protein